MRRKTEPGTKSVRNVYGELLFTNSPRELVQSHFAHPSGSSPKVSSIALSTE